MRTGVCYYPEHWPPSRWQQDAQAMRAIGLTVVRVGEFAWSRLEPTPGDYRFDWLEQAIDTLHAAGLSVVLGTPTATPPRWLLERHPDILASDEQGQVRQFGSRRHYCFSSATYRAECARIVTALAERFGSHPGLIAWQTDNEYGCHDTTLSYSADALSAFQRWCEQRYTTIDALNTAWGNVFWSMEYTRFEQIGFPVSAVTETSPAHRLAFWRFSSAQIASFNRLQVEILHKLSPGRDVVHNFMGYFPDFDHRLVAEDLDVAAWDNYPLGQLVRHGTDAERETFLRTGHPDSSAFHHDLYRNCGHGRMWLMEQQPGPVNWAPYNPAPLPGMVHLWGWEAFAHGAEVVSYFRWRQAPFAQEQMHTGLLLPDGSEDIGAAEVRELSSELPILEDLDTATRQAPVALYYDYTGDCLQRIQQPGGLTRDPLLATMQIYTACRRSGVDVDIVGPADSLAGYALVLLATATESDPALVQRLQTCKGQIVLFPRTGSKCADNTIPDNLPPGAFQSLIRLRITRVESLPPAAAMMATPGDTGRNALRALHWREWVDSALQPASTFEDALGLHYRDGRVHYLNAWLDEESLISFIAQRLDELGLPAVDLGPGLRTRLCGDVRFAFNYGPDAASLGQSPWQALGLGDGKELLLGERRLPPGGVAAWLV